MQSGLKGITAPVGVGNFRFKPGGAASRSRTAQAKIKETVSVRDFGAVGNNNGTAGNGVDDRAAFQSALDYIKLTGQRLFIPAGHYRIGSPGLSMIFSAANFVEAKCSIVGEGARVSQLVFDNGTFDGVTLAGPTTPIITGQHFKDFGLIKTDGLGKGLVMVRLPHVLVENIEIIAWGTGLYGLDVQEGLFNNITANFNLGGAFFSRDVASQPNALVFNGCTFGNSQNFGMDIVDPGTFTYVGGSIESNGQLGAAPVKWGVRLSWTTTIAEANVACTFNSVYFERNAGKGDIYLANSQIPMSWNVIGCSFNRGEVGTGTGIYGTSCVTIETSGSVKNVLNLVGNGMGGLPRSGGSAYPPSAARPYVTITNPTEPLTVVDIGNRYTDAVETPIWDCAGGVSVVGTQSTTVLGTLVSNNGDANAGPIFELFRASPSPATNDFISALHLSAFNSSASKIAGARLVARLLDHTAGTEDFELNFFMHVAGAAAQTFALANGAIVGAPTGGYKGTGSINAAAGLYTNGIGVLSGSGAPGGVVSAPKGSLYTNITATTTTTRLYVNTDGGTTWANFTASA